MKVDRISGATGLWRHLVSFFRKRRDTFRKRLVDTENPDPDGVEAATSQDTTAPQGPVHRLVVSFDASQWPSSGVLSEMDYHVGKNGLAPADRRRILQKVLEAELVATSPETEDYVREWGAPRSVERRRKIARCIAGFAAGARRKTAADMSAAIADWESDLDWFTTTFGR
jgi:hypothetical protein